MKKSKLIIENKELNKDRVVQNFIIFYLFVVIILLLLLIIVSGRIAKVGYVATSTLEESDGNIIEVCEDDVRMGTFRTTSYI